MTKRLFLAAMSAGSLIALAAPAHADVKAGVDAWGAGDYATALNLQDKLMPLHQAIFTEPGLVGAKYAMSQLGLCSDEVRLPLTPLTESTKGLIRDALRHAGLLN